MHATAITDDGRFELRRPGSKSEWAAYHSIRERSFYVPFGLDKIMGPYDPAFPDQYRDEYTPLVLIRNGIVVGTLGLQDMGDGVVQVRAVGVEPACQHRGYGTIMISLAEDLARRHGFTRAWVYSDESAVMFYARNAYTHGAARTIEIPDCPLPGAVILAKRLTQGLMRPSPDVLIAAA